jgi:hypothetical protein
VIYKTPLSDICNDISAFKKAVSSDGQLLKSAQLLANRYFRFWTHDMDVFLTELAARPHPATRKFPALDSGTQ